MAGRIQRNIDGSLEIRGMALAPSGGGPFDISPSIQRTIANLAALDGTFTRMLACDGSGRLKVVDVGASAFGGALYDTGYSIGEIAYDTLMSQGDASHDGGLWYGGASLASMVYTIKMMLTDVYSSCAHAVKTDEIP